MKKLVSVVLAICLIFSVFSVTTNSLEIPGMDCQLLNLTASRFPDDASFDTVSYLGSDNYFKDDNFTYDCSINHFIFKKQAYYIKNGEIRPGYTNYFGFKIDVPARVSAYLSEGAYFGMFPDYIYNGSIESYGIITDGIFSDTSKIENHGIIAPYKRNEDKSGNFVFNGAIYNYPDGTIDTVTKYDGAEYPYEHTISGSGVIYNKGTITPSALAIMSDGITILNQPVANSDIKTNYRYVVGGNILVSGGFEDNIPLEWQYSVDGENYSELDDAFKSIYCTGFTGENTSDLIIIGVTDELKNVTLRCVFNLEPEFFDTVVGEDISFVNHEENFITDTVITHTFSTNFNSSAYEVPEELKYCIEFVSGSLGAGNQLYLNGYHFDSQNGCLSEGTAHYFMFGKGTNYSLTLTVRKHAWVFSSLSELFNADVNLYGMLSFGNYGSSCTINNHGSITTYSKPITFNDTVIYNYDDGIIGIKNYHGEYFDYLGTATIYNKGTITQGALSRFPDTYKIVSAPVFADAQNDVIDYELSDTLTIFRPTVDDYNMTYTWQYSENGMDYINIPADFSDYAEMVTINGDTIILTNPTAELENITLRVVAQNCEKVGFFEDAVCDAISFNYNACKYGHTESEPIIDEIATCKDEGKWHTVCTVCETILNSGTIEKTNEHTPEIIEGYPATETEPGLTDGEKCSVCGIILIEQQVIEPLGHTHTPVKIEGYPATETEPGLTDGEICSTCGAILIEQQVIEPLGHVHTPVKINGYEPTCTLTGLTDGEQCSECGQILVYQEVIDALGHDYVDGVCSRCGVIPVENCKCKCHSDSKFRLFFWKIRVFFWKIFNITDKRYCECGAAHW